MKTEKSKRLVGALIFGTGIAGIAATLWRSSWDRNALPPETVAAFEELRDAPSSDEKFSQDLKDIVSETRAPETKGKPEIPGVAIEPGPPTRATGSSYGDAGKFDSYVLALSWWPAFCKVFSYHESCRTQTSEGYAAKNLVLHGLWPQKEGDKWHNYGYCGLAEEIKNLDQLILNRRRPATQPRVPYSPEKQKAPESISPNGWSLLPPVPLAAETLRNLALYMPSLSARLERHEWIRHGSCSGLGADEYFATASALVAKISETSFNRYLSAHVGETIKRHDLHMEFERDFGYGSWNSVMLSCKSNGGGSDMLLDVQIYLKNPAPPEGDLRGSLVPRGSSDYGNCPEEFFIERAATR